MLKHLFYFLIFAFQFVFLSSCFVTYGDNIQKSYTLIKVDSTQLFKKPVLLYFDNEEINYQYIKLGYVEVKGAENSNNQELLEHLKYEAWRNGANAIININDNFSSRQSGTYLNKESKINYDSHIFKGVAIKLNEVDYNKNIDNLNDTLFISKTLNYQHHIEKRTGNQFKASLIAVALLTGLIIYLAVKK
jgi:hypothetical protein